jgi:hypothetical protein
MLEIETHSHEGERIKELNGNNSVLFCSVLVNEIILIQLTYALYDEMYTFSFMIQGLSRYLILSCQIFFFF